MYDLLLFTRIFYLHDVNVSHHSLLTGGAVSRPQHLELPQDLGRQRVPHDQEPPDPVGQADRVVVHLGCVGRSLVIY